MDHNKKSQSGSSSSLTSQLFGSHDSSSSSSSDVLASIFPPSKGMGRNSAYNDARGSWQKEPSGNQPWNNKQDNSYIHGDPTKDHSSIYQQEGASPCHLSSSLYYGGRETYSKPHSNQSSTPYPVYKKDGGEDDPSGASRGNWWQGSLYY